MTKEESKKCTRWHELYAISEEPCGELTLIDMVMDLEEQVRNLNGAIAGQNKQIKELEDRNGNLIKEIRKVKGDYLDLEQKKIVCPGEAARYYLEETRKLKSQLASVKNTLLNEGV